MTVRARIVAVMALVCTLLVSSSGVGPVPSVAAADDTKSWRLNVQTVEVAGTTIAYAELGRGRPLLLLNGTGSPMAHWDPRLLTLLSRHHRVIVFDYPGLGGSGPPPRSITIARMARWSVGLLDALDIKRTDVLGWSMGGFVTQVMLRRYPERIRRAVLAGTNPGGSRTRLGPAWAQRLDSDPDAGLAGYLRTNYPRTQCAQRHGRASVRRVNQAIATGRYPPERIPASTYRAMVRAEDPWLRSNTNWRALRHVRRPVLVIAGTNDVLTPPSNSKQIAARLPRGRSALVRGAGHAFLFQDPKTTDRVLVRFFARGTAPKRVASSCIG